MHIVTYYKDVEAKDVVYISIFTLNILVLIEHVKLENPFTVYP